MAADALLSTSKNIGMPLWNFFRDTRNVFKKDELGLEITQIALPAALALAADPIASLIDTAFIGHIGPVELAAVGVSIAVFNQVSKIAIFPLVSVTTSFVAEEEAATSLGVESNDIEIVEKGFNGDNEKEELIPKIGDVQPEPTSKLPPTNIGMVERRNKKRHLSSASSALFIGAILGLIQTLFLIIAAKPILNYMGVKSDSLMLIPAQQYLTVRALGAPAVLLSLAMQGVFRGFKDTKTPLYGTVLGDAANIILDPIFIFLFGMGVSGAAIAHVISQYLISLFLLWRLMGEVTILPPSVHDLQFGRFFKNGSMLLWRVIAATSCVTLAASLSARSGPTSMAAFQVCLQVWLATSLLADGLAVAAQAIIASAFAKKDYEKAIAAAFRVLQFGLVLGFVLCIVVAAVLHFAAGLFTKDIAVLKLLTLGIPFVAGTQPINSLAFVFDGINFGASDFAYSAYSMVFVSLISIVCLFMLSSSHGFIGIWIALSFFMSFRATAGFWRLGTRTGPWVFLRG